MLKYGRFHDICRDTGNRWSTVPVCNLFNQSPARTDNAPGWGGCDLLGIHLHNNHVLANLGSIFISFIAILTTLYFMTRAFRRRGAVGRIEMQFFLGGYALISFCEILTVGGFPLMGVARRGFSAIHIGAVLATSYALFANALVGFQFVADGIKKSVAAVAVPAAVLFVGACYVALDVGFSWTDHFKSSLDDDNHSNWLYTLYLLLPLMFLSLFYLFELFLVLGKLRELRPTFLLTLSLIFFAVGQIFQFVASPHICNGTGNNINGGFFEVLFTYFSVCIIFVFWNTITEKELAYDGRQEMDEANGYI